MIDFTNLTKEEKLQVVNTIQNIYKEYKPYIKESVAEHYSDLLEDYETDIQLNKCIRFIYDILDYGSAPYWFEKDKFNEFIDKYKSDNNDHIFKVDEDFYIYIECVYQDELTKDFDVFRVKKKRKYVWDIYR